MAKLVEILAQELKEWPANALEYITQDDNGRLNTNCSERTPVFNGSGSWTSTSCNYLFYPNFELYELTEVAEDFGTAVVTKEMWEAERNKIKGETTEKNCAGLDQKQHPKAGILTIRDRIYQIEDELVKLQQEKESLVTLLKEEGFILVKNVVENEVPNSEYMIDPNNWKKGDLITYVGEDIAGEFTSGSIYEFEGVDVNGWVDVLMDDAGNPNGTRPEWFVWRSRPTD